MRSGDEETEREKKRHEQHLDRITRFGRWIGRLPCNTPVYDVCVCVSRRPNRTEYEMLILINDK